MRRLPVYLLLDTSYSMSGEPIESVKTGLDTLVKSLRQDPAALETAHLSVITFSSQARQIIPLTELIDFQAPDLSVDGATSMGEALELLASCINKEVRNKDPNLPSDWRPLVFLFTDGCATDNLTRGISEIKKLKFGAFVACAAGAQANIHELKRITEIVVSLDTADSRTISQFFAWVSASISVSSKNVNSGGDTSGFSDLPPPPPEIKISLEK